MPLSLKYDAIIIGSGPNGFAAAITLAQAGLKVAIYEAKETIGGGMRSAALTLPGYIHDICSAIHPLGIGSPFFRTLPLNQYGLQWIQPQAPLAHPFDDGTAIILERSLNATCAHLGSDGNAYSSLMQPIVANWNHLENDLLSPLHFPKHPLLMARFGFYGLRSASSLSKQLFKGIAARSLFIGLAAHAILPLDKPLTSAFGMILAALGHTFGWPLAQSGSQTIANALSSFFHSLGGTVITNANIQNIDELPPSRAILCDISPKQLLQIAGHRFPSSYKEALNKYRYGPGVFKVDWALDRPIPWKSKECLHAGTLHLGGSDEEIIQSEREVWEGKPPQKPYVLFAQQSLFDPTRAPGGKQTAWAYCHVPNGSSFDMTNRIEAQVERFAPGFLSTILAKKTTSAIEFAHYNSNYVGGDINGGVQDIYQMYTRPAMRLVPYSTPVNGLYICSSSTPPGGGVHGMCGFHAAKAVLKHCFAKKQP